MRVQFHSQTLALLSVFSIPMDVVFQSLIQSLPRELHEALAEAELLDSRVLDAYPRSSAEELGLLSASQVPARIRRTRKGAGLQSVGDSFSPSLVTVLASTPLSAGVEQLVDDDFCGPTLVNSSSVCSSLEPVCLARSLNVTIGAEELAEKPCITSEESSSVCRSVEPVSLASAAEVKFGAPEVADKSSFTDASCHSGFRLAKVESSKTSRQSQPGSTRDGESSKNARQCQPVSSRGQHGAERSARRGGRATRGNVALTVEVTAAQDDASEVGIVLNPADEVAGTAEKDAAREMAPSDAAIVLKSELPIVCHAGTQEVLDTMPSSENSVVPNVVISSSCPVLCLPHPLDSESFPDETLLFHTLVRDGVLQLAFQDDFEKLARAAQTSARRHRRQRAGHGNLEAALELHEHKRKVKEQERVQKRVLDQFAAAANLPQRRYHARFQSSLEEGPTARRDAEEAERLRWVT